MQTQVPSARPPRIGVASLQFFVALSCLYLLLARGRTTSVDELHVYATAESLAERGSWRMELSGVQRAYSRYSVVPSLLGVPLCAAATPIADRLADEMPGAVEPESRRIILRAAVSLQTPLITAGTAALLLFGMCRLGFRPGSSLSATLIFAVGTLALPYSGSLYVQPAAALALVCVVLTSLLEFDVLLAWSLVLLFAIRFELLVIVPLLGLQVLRFRTPITRGVACLASGVVGGIAVHVLVNTLRNDHWLSGDYGGEAFSTPIGLGLWSLLFSSGKGLVWFAPAAALGLTLLPSFARQMPRFGVLALGIAATMLIMVSGWWTWHGAWSWGPRLLVPLMPVLVIPFAWLFDCWEQQPAGRRWLVIMIAAVSTAVQFRGVLGDPLADRHTLGPLVNENESIYVPQVGPWGADTDGGLDILLCRLWRDVSAWRIGLAIAAGILVLAVIAFGTATLRTLGIKRTDFSAWVPRCQPREWIGVAGCLLLVSAPSVFEWWSTTQIGASDAKLPEGLARQFRAFSPVRGSGRWEGQLYAPVRGDYLFFQVGPDCSRIWLNGQPLFGSTSGVVVVGTAELDVGFHRLEIEPAASQHASALYWTTPGNAYYKEAVSAVYLPRIGAGWREQCALWAVQWRWLVCVIAVVGCVHLIYRSP